MYAFFVQNYFFCQNVTREKLCEAIFYEKHLRKMLMKWTPGFIIGDSGTRSAFETGRGAARHILKKLQLYFSYLQ